jgi:plastocyanin
MRRSPIVLTIALAAVLAACGSSSEPGWTYAPPTEAPASVAPSGDASTPPSSEAPASEAPASEAPASEAPTSEAPASQAPPSEPPASEAPASGAPASEAPSSGAGDVVTLTAVPSLTWGTPELTVPADTAFTLRFDNQDTGIPHDVVIKDASGATVASSSIITAPATEDVQVPALAAGSYPFNCSVHPAMVGTITAGS